MTSIIGWSRWDATCAKHGNDKEWIAYAEINPRMDIVILVGGNLGDIWVACFVASGPSTTVKDSLMANILIEEIEDVELAGIDITISCPGTVSPNNDIIIIGFRQKTCLLTWIACADISNSDRSNRVSSCPNTMSYWPPVCVTLKIRMVFAPRSPMHTWWTLWLISQVFEISSPYSDLVSAIKTSQSWKVWP